MLSCFQNYLVKSVIDTYENVGPMHLSHKYSTGIVESGRENFYMHPPAGQQQRGLTELKTGIFSLRAIVDQAREGLCC